MLKLFKVSLIVLSTFIFLNAPAFAQYDSDGFDGKPNGDGEVFGINVEEGETATIFPTGCNFVESITIKVKKDLRGSIEIKSFGDKNPVENKGISGKVLEFCELSLKGFSKDDIESSIVKSKAGKEALEDKGIKSEDVRLFQYDENGKKWEQKNTSKKSESSVNVFFESESIDKFTHIALGEKTGGFNLNYLPFIICGFLLLLVIIIMIIAASTARRRDQEQYEE